MPGWLVAVIIAVVVIIILVAVLSAMRKKKTDRLQDRFGPEYDRTIARADGKRDAEKDLDARAERRAELNIRPLPAASRDRYQQEWDQTQAHFVDDPRGSISDADRLVHQVMEERGYPVGDDFERNADDVSVDHPHLVENFRGAHDIAEESKRGEVSTEDQRQAMVHYRSLFSELLGDDGRESRAAAVAPDRAGR